MSRLARIDNNFRLYPGAVRIYRSPSASGRAARKTETPAKRSGITSFSSHSRLRLREALAKSDIPGCEKYGLTLTLPWRDLPTDCCKQYKRLFNLFGVAFRRAFPSSAAIFRHELQVRMAPHCHMVFYLGVTDRCQCFDLLRDKLAGLWLAALDVVGYYGGSRSGAMSHSCKLEPLDDLPSLFRYVADHTSKHKQAQLGYQGKQWGYLNRHLLVCPPMPLFRFPSDDAKVSFVRHVTKLGRFSIKIPISAKRDYFKSYRQKKVSRRKITSIQFVGLSTSLRLAEWLGAEMQSERFDNC